MPECKKELRIATPEELTKAFTEAKVLRGKNPMPAVVEATGP